MSDSLASSLLQAATSGDVDAVRAALDAGAAADGLASEPSSPLVEAIRQRHVDVVRLLLERGASVERLVYTRTPLSVACQIDGYRELRDAKAPATIAILDALLAAGADPDAKTGAQDYPPLRVAIRSATPEVVLRLLEARPSVDPSHVYEAVEQGMLPVVRPLMAKAGVDPSQLLLRIARRGSREQPWADLAKLLLAQRAAPNISTAEGATPALWAAYWTDLPMLRTLVQAGANLDAKTTRTWVPEDAPKKKGISPRSLLEDALRWERRYFDDGSDIREQWEQTARALGRSLDEWLAAIDAPAEEAQGPEKKKKPKAKASSLALEGAWRAVLVTETGPNGIIAIDEEEGGSATITLREDKTFSLESGGLLCGCAGTWESDGAELRLLIEEDEIDRDELRLTIERDGATTLLILLDNEGDTPLRWTFER